MLICSTKVSHVKTTQNVNKHHGKLYMHKKQTSNKMSNLKKQHKK